MNRTLLVGLVGLLALGCEKKQDARNERQATPQQATPGGGEKGDGKSHAGEAPGSHEDHGPEEEGEAHERVIALSPEAVRAAGIRTVVATMRPLSVALSAPARVTFTQTGVARVSPRVPGRLDTIDVRLGQRVRRGTVLGYVESPELGRARGDYLAAATRARVAEANFQREKELLEKGISSEREMREAESVWAAARGDMAAAEAHLHALGLSDAEIGSFRLEEHPSPRFPARSPIDGTVVEIQATVGQAVESTTPLFTVGDLERLWVLLDVFESQLPLVELGQKVAISVAALPDRVFDGHIEYIGDVVDEKSRAVRVRVAVDNRKGLLKPGMFASATVAARASTQKTESESLVVPREAVQKLGDEHVVFVPAGDNKYRAIEVQVGLDMGKEVELVAGLDVGQSIVTTGAFVLKSELSKEAMSGGHSGHGH